MDEAMDEVVEVVAEKGEEIEPANPIEHEEDSRQHEDITEEKEEREEKEEKADKPEKEFEPHFGPFAPNEQVLCHHFQQIFEAKVLKEKMSAEGHPLYFVHYKGWNRKWDEWVPVDRLLKWNEENLEKRRQLIGSQQEQIDESPEDSGAPAPAPHPARKRHKPAVDALKKEKEKFRLLFPPVLRNCLTHDWDRVTRRGLVPMLPREVTVAGLLTDFVQTRRNKESIRQFAAQFQLYFDKVLGKLLLYKEERSQFNAALSRFPTLAPSEVYGSEHLLRLLAKLPQLVAFTEMNDADAERLQAYAGELLYYLTDHVDVGIFTDRYAPRDEEGEVVVL